MPTAEPAGGAAIPRGGSNVASDRFGEESCPSHDSLASVVPAGNATTDTNSAAAMKVYDVANPSPSNPVIANIVNNPSNANTGVNPPGRGNLITPTENDTSFSFDTCTSDDPAIHTDTAFRTRSGSIITMESTFPTFLHIWTLTQELRIASGMKRSTLNRKSSENFDADASLERFGVKQFIPPIDNGHTWKSFAMPCRGNFGCNVQGCCFEVGYSYQRRRNHYTLSQGSCFTHNHPSTGTDLEGNTQVKNASDLDDEEIKTLNLLAVTCIGMAKIRESMFIHFPKRDYDTKLLERMVNKELDRKFGTNRDQIGELMAKGRKCERNGGIWEPEIGSTLHIIGCHYQTATNRAYARQYGTYYFTADGTHETNKYSNTCVPFVSPDCLGLSHPIGTGIYQSENGVDIAKGIKLFGLSSKPDDKDTEEVRNTYYSCINVYFNILLF